MTNVVQSRYPSLDLIRGILHGAKVLLTHFHLFVRGLKAIDNLVGSSEESEKFAQRTQLKDYQLEALRTLIPEARREGILYPINCTAFNYS